jgi:hypothetical protein
MTQNSHLGAKRASSAVGAAENSPGREPGDPGKIESNEPAKRAAEVPVAPPGL